MQLMIQPEGPHLLKLHCLFPLDNALLTGPLQETPHLCVVMFLHLVIHPIIMEMTVGKESLKRAGTMNAPGERIVMATEQDKQTRIESETGSVSGVETMTGMVGGRIETESMILVGKEIKTEIEIVTGIEIAETTTGTVRGGTEIEAGTERET